MTQAIDQSAIDAALSHGVQGVLGLAILGLVVALGVLWKTLQAERVRADGIQQAHIDDLKNGATLNAQQNERVWKAADDIGRAADILNRR